MTVSIEEDTKSFLAMLKKEIVVKSGTYPKKILIAGMGGSGIGGRIMETLANYNNICLLYTSPSPRDLSTSRMPSSA